MNTTTTVMVLVFVVPIMTCQTFSQVSQWESMGPGEVSVMAVNPANPSEVITGSVKSGVFKSTDQGQTWRFSGAGLPVGDPNWGAEVTALRYDPTNPLTIYAGTGTDGTWPGRGLFKSTNGGETWDAVSYGLPDGSTVRSIDVSVHDPQIVFASIIHGSTVRGLYVSANGGQSWSSSLQYSDESGPVMVDRYLPGSVYTVDGSGTFYRSTDYGKTWSQTPNNLQMYGSRRLVREGMFSPFFLASTYRGAFKSIDGQHIAPINNGLPAPLESNARYSDIIQDSTYLYITAGDSGVFRSSDEGASWQKVFDLATWWIQKARNGILIATSAGLYKSVDMGATWSFVSCDIGTGIIADVEVAQSDPSSLLAAGGWTVYRSGDHGRHWKPVLIGRDVINATAIDPSDENINYVCAGGFFTDFLGLFRSTDRCQTWLDKSPQPLLPVTAIEVRRDSPNVVFVGSPGAVWKTTDRGDTWALVLVRPGSNETAVMRVAPSDPRVIYIGTTSNDPDLDGVWVTEDGGTSWERRVNGFPEGISYTSVISLAVDPQNAATAYAGNWAVGIWKTTDHGNLWYQLKNGLPMSGVVSVYEILADQNDPLRLYAAIVVDNDVNLCGVYETHDGGNTWSRLSAVGLYDNLPTSLARTMVGTSEVLYLGTYGGGVFCDNFNAVSVDSPQGPLPLSFHLFQNYPNPSNPGTTIRFELPKSLEVRLTVYDILGREALTLVRERKEAGVHEIKFDGSAFASGVYIYRLQAGDFVQTKKLIVLK